MARTPGGRRQYGEGDVGWLQAQREHIRGKVAYYRSLGEIQRNLDGPARAR